MPVQTPVNRREFITVYDTDAERAAASPLGIPGGQLVYSRDTRELRVADGSAVWTEPVGSKKATFWIVNLSTAMRTLQPTVRRFSDQDGKICANAIQQQILNDVPQGWPLIATPNVRFWTKGTTPAKLAQLYADPFAYPMFVVDGDPDTQFFHIHGEHGSVGDPLFTVADETPAWDIPQIPLAPPVGRPFSVNSTITRISLDDILVESFAVTGAIIPPGISTQCPEGSGALAGNYFPATCAVLSHEILETLVNPIGVTAQDIGQYAGFPIYDPGTDTYLPLSAVPSPCAQAGNVVWPDTDPDTGLSSAGGPFMYEAAAMECADAVDRLLALGTGYYQKTVKGFGPPKLADVANFVFQNWFNPSWAIADAYADAGAALPTGLLPTPPGQRYDFLNQLVRAFHVIPNPNPTLYPTSGPTQFRVLPSSIAGVPIEPNITTAPPCATFPPGDGAPSPVQSCPAAPPVTTPPGSQTVIWFGSDGLSLPQPVIFIYPGSSGSLPGTANFPPSGTIIVETSLGPQTVTYTGLTPDSFTGCLGGAGVMSAFNLVSAPATGSRIPTMYPMLDTIGSIGFDMTFLLSAPNTDPPMMMGARSARVALPSGGHSVALTVHGKRGRGSARAKAFFEARKAKKATR